MFTRMPGDRVISDEGFEVTILYGNCRDCMTLKYVEGERCLPIDVYFEARSNIEQTWKEPSILIVEVPFKLAWSNLSAESMAQEEETLLLSERSRVLVNIESALNYMKIGYRIRVE